jgi:hypothetical protein
MRRRPIDDLTETAPDGRPILHYRSVSVVRRPYLLTFASGNRYPLTSEDAQRLIDEYPIITATRNRVTLRGDDGTRSTITPATIGGGVAFEVTK